MMADFRVPVGDRIRLANDVTASRPSLNEGQRHAVETIERAVHWYNLEEIKRIHQ